MNAADPAQLGPAQDVESGPSRLRDDYFGGSRPGIVGATGFFGCLGFFFSLLLRCCPLAIADLLRLWCRHYDEEQDREEGDETAVCLSFFSVAHGQKNKLKGKSEKVKGKIGTALFLTLLSPFTFHLISYLPGRSI